MLSAADTAGAVGGVAFGATWVSAPFWLLRLAVLRAGTSIGGAVGSAAAAGTVTALEIHIVRTDESSTAALILLPGPVVATLLGGAVLVVDAAARALVRRWRARRAD